MYDARRSCTLNPSVRLPLIVLLMALRCPCAPPGVSGHTVTVMTSEI